MAGAFRGIGHDRRGAGKPIGTPISAVISQSRVTSQESESELKNVPKEFTLENGPILP
jgi:hypothetical protein